MPKAVYTKGPIETRMLKTTATMLPATLALSGYNIVDTYFVSKLGTDALAAIGFTFPMVMLVGCVYRGLGTGCSTPLAHALGGNKHAKGAKIVSSGLLLVLLLSLILGSSGYFTINSVFSSFGAGEKILPLVRDYMAVWYLGSLTAALSMVGNNIMIASGSSKTASSITMGSMVLNLILDPLFIFGWGPIPSLGIQGAAIATIISQFAAAFALIYLIHRKLQLISTHVFKKNLIFHTWTVIMKMAFPSILSMLMMPLGNAVTTRITAVFGSTAVAACAAAGRLEMMAFILPMAFGISMTPFIAQNFGAKLYKRIRHCYLFAIVFAFSWLLVVTIVYFFGAPAVSSLFSDNQDVIDIMGLYLKITAWGYGLLEIHRYSGFFFTGSNRPRLTLRLNLLRIVILLIPLSMLAYYLHSLPGLFVARLVTDILAGLVGVIMVFRFMKKVQ